MIIAKPIEQVTQEDDRMELFEQVIMTDDLTGEEYKMNKSIGIYSKQDLEMQKSQIEAEYIIRTQQIDEKLSAFEK